MSKFNDLEHWVDNLLHPQPVEYTRKDGNIMRLDDAGLKRPLGMTRQAKLIMAALVVAGIVIGAMILNNTVYETARQAKLAQDSVETNIQREASADTLPNLASYVTMSDDEIKAAIEQQGFSIYDATTESDSGITVYKLPSDVSVIDAGLLYSRGISKLTASQATLLLNGSWQLGTKHDSGTTIVVRYADFKSTSAESAISLAMSKEGIEAGSVSDSGTDDSGNTYRSGTLEANGATYTWRVSAIDLSKIYDISGIPSPAYYVGIRLTQNA